MFGDRGMGMSSGDTNCVPVLEAQGDGLSKAESLVALGKAHDEN